MATKTDLVNLNKIERMAHLALENGLRLHKDSTLLFNKRSYPSAYFLSILSLEEIGKFFLIEDFWWHSKIDGRMEKEWEEKFIGLIYLHRPKQNSFAYNLDGPFPRAKFTKQLFGGNLEEAKQNAVYVGLPKHKGKINLKGKINNPVDITKNKTQKQITNVNDKIIEFTLGITKGVYSIETDKAERTLNKKLYNELRKLWPMTTRITDRKLKRLKNV